MNTVDFNQLSQWGLITKINHEILHPLGLALSYDVETGKSAGCVVAPDLYFEFPKDVVKEHNKKYEDFLRDRYNILTGILGTEEESNTGGTNESRSDSVL